MKELNLIPYEIPGHAEKYDPKVFICETLFSPLLKLAGKDLLDSFNLGNKIQNAGDSILLDDKEYAKVKRITDLPSMIGAALGFGRNEVEMIRRILEAPDVEVQKKDA